MAMTTFLPKQVLIIRHAEKPALRGDRGLSPRGRARASALVDTFPAQFGAPDIIIACADKASSTRPVDTIKPLADRLRLPIEDQWNNQDYGALAHALQTNQAFSGRRVLICWRTETLAELGRALGAPTTTWPKTDFDTVWVITFQPTHRFQVTRQAIEPRDLDLSIGGPG
jgi:phosphohistidine phosphatase SixA